MAALRDIFEAPKCDMKSMNCSWSSCMTTNGTSPSVTLHLFPMQVLCFGGWLCILMWPWDEKATTDKTLYGWGDFRKKWINSFFVRPRGTDKMISLICNHVNLVLDISCVRPLWDQSQVHGFSCASLYLMLAPLFGTHCMCICIIPLQTKRAPVEPQIVKNNVENSMEKWHFARFMYYILSVCIDHGRIIEPWERWGVETDQSLLNVKRSLYQSLFRKVFPSHITFQKNKQTKKHVNISIKIHWCKHGLSTSLVPLCLPTSP